VRRFCFENVWSYFAPLQCAVEALPATSCFVFGDAGRYLAGDTLEPEVAVREERAAFETGLANFHAMLKSRGYEVRSRPIT
jgi:hypothetical protein